MFASYANFKYVQNQNPFRRRPFLILVLISAVVLLGGLVLCLYEREYGTFDGSILFRDPNAISKNPFYYGAISNLGCLLWCATASISFFTSYNLACKGNREFELFLLTGALSAILCIDDVFMLHEAALPAIGAPEYMTYLVEGALLGYILVKFARKILESFWLPLLFALGFLSFSVLLDEAPPFRAQTTVEDTVKFVGITFWLYYFGDLASKASRAT